MSRAEAQRAAALRAAFGTDSDEDERESAAALQPAVERHALVHGLCVLRRFLAADEQAQLLAALRTHGWIPPDVTARNQAMHFAYATMPPFLRHLADSVAAAVAVHALFPPQLVAREPPFNQAICNCYAPGAAAARCVHAAVSSSSDVRCVRAPMQARALRRMLTSWRLPTASRASPSAPRASWTLRASAAVATRPRCRCCCALATC